MRIGISGYGQMGKLIHQICLERGHLVPVIIDPQPAGVPDGVNVLPSAKELDKAVDAVIDFSLPAGILSNIESYLEKGIPAVIGTTGWEAHHAEIGQKVTQTGGTILHGSNFSVGANLFFLLTQKLAGLINQFPQYDLLLHEFHHKRKQDSPSGTAITAANLVVDALQRKTTIQTETLQRRIQPEEFHVTASRGGEFPGLHMLLADSVEDTIELRHTARSRRGFALGAVLSAEWISGKTGFFSFQDFFSETLSRA